MDFLRKQLPIAIIGIAIIGGTFLLGFRAGAAHSEAIAAPVGIDLGTGEPSGLDLTAFWKVWNTLNDKFVPTASTTKVADNQDKLWGAIEGLASSYGDPYTVFFPPKDNESFQTQINGNFSGVGMEIGIKEGALTVISPLKGTPAEQAGVKTGDRILAIDGKPTDGLPVDDAVSQIRGPEGSTVTLTLLHDGAKNSTDVKITRATIEIPTVDTKLRDDGVFVISLYTFTGESPNLFREALRQFILSNSDKLVLDLRGNPGGYLEAAVDMASWFLPAGKTVVTEDFGGKETNAVHRSLGYDVFNKNLKMVVLINGGSASASEILAGALSEHGIATLVGEKSFGKGSVQELVDITKDTALKVTVAKWLTPGGHSISGNGITPDYVVPMTEADAVAGRDPQMEKAASLLLAK